MTHSIIIPRNFPNAQSYNELIDFTKNISKFDFFNDIYDDHDQLQFHKRDSAIEFIFYYLSQHLNQNENIAEDKANDLDFDMGWTCLEFDTNGDFTITE